jgi:hypothetical protein
MHEHCLPHIHPSAKRYFQCISYDGTTIRNSIGIVADGSQEFLNSSSHPVPAESTEGRLGWRPVFDGDSYDPESVQHLGPLYMAGPALPDPTWPVDCHGCARDHVRDP